MIFACLLSLSISGIAYHSLQEPASEQIQLRTFQKEKLQKYLNDEDFKYDREFKPEAPNLWQRFKIWLLTKILQALSNEQTFNFWKWAIYILCGLVILYVILKLTKTNVRGLFFGQAQSGKMAFSETQENIHELNFEKLIAEAIAAQQYGKAIRLFYLKILKELTDRKLIDWRINKTNYDYVRELGAKDLAPSFRNLTFLFEYIYYGDFPITQTDFEQAQSAFKNFEEQLKR
ncbi:DUF4129 domain-containing protein [Rhodocytophaga rosea]|uniref:DUF4129 domain-containing protein n=1 Tax=Rhodocytophaga rosea TaxID=2704465 RepID=A0A6C0GQU7_9BACT|nr:DUF4129 domain-containing protein [Rhodocytophaga rosea]QHT69880.1 DUF4129 domain-containing protein [Rhodocytophaga rosea]